jgi:protein SCO1/2
MKLRSYKTMIKSSRLHVLFIVGIVVLVVAFTAYRTKTILHKPDESHSYDAQGIVEKISEDRHQVTIHHQAIPNYMMEMTMDFPVKDPNELQGLFAGDKVTFTLNVSDDDAWVTHLERTGHTDQVPSDVVADDEVPKLKPGDMVPDSELISEDGHPIHFSDFRGKAVAFTFFFTRCPLPNYCPLMNKNFGQTRTLLKTAKGPENWELLSISFDSDFDQPNVLSSYGKFYRGDDASHWLFASASSKTLAELAPRVGLMLMRQDNNISHNLRTIVVDTNGRLFCQFNDNLWTAQQLAEALTKASRIPVLRP